ncbi:hypothetical protein BJG92_03528 [Arthrobacter sp. SO5]|uniref:hypothetical protein n=1 Tax=Arthrobacter sp. SO5 TaxID=1897055 RepID=UPI001E2B9038|nr:hypothetical protein [Arthrobacter sp. SO5]MCB5275973.1 hypothetical protein [Arthrobacter sp. SO5]
MKFWRSIMKLPQPLKGGLVAYVIVFAVAFLSVPASAIFSPGKASPVTFWGIGALGVTAIVLGVMLAVDLRGSADAYVSFIKDYKPMGVDYSKSFVANPKFVRIFGIVFIIVGLLFVVNSTIMALP